MLKFLFEYGILFILIFLLYIFATNIFSYFKEKKNFKPTLSFKVCLISLLQYVMIDVIMNEKYATYPGASFLNLLFLLSFNYLFSLFKASGILTSLFTLVLYLLSMSERYVVLFKGMPYTIHDIGAAKTAFSVAAGYDFTPEKGMIIGTFLFIAIILIGFIFKLTVNKKQVLIEFIIPFIIVFSTLISFGIDRENIKAIGDINIFNGECAINNYKPALYLYIDYLCNSFSYPKDFDEEAIISKINDIEEEDIDSNLPSAVNVICILDEAFYDTSLLWDLETDGEVLPYFNSSHKNTLSGYSVVSTFGGGTSNSEYEFLMGGNLLFLPHSSYPFSSYIHKDTSSLASILKSQGFKTIAYHPYEKSNWNRDAVYPLIGFDDFYGDKEIVHSEISDYSNTEYGYLSDEACFKDIEKFFEEKDKDEKLFVWTVTMQNHSPYFCNDENNYLEIIRTSTGNRSLNHYLSLMNMTDKAIENLFNYFDNIDEPTVILVFGDHAPGSLFDYDDVATDDEKILYTHATPYLIHTNFDTNIPELNSKFISLSYLQTLLMDMGNLKKDKEQLFVQSYMEKYPILSSNVYGSFDNLNINTDNYSEDLKDYRDFVYTKLNKD